MYLAQNKKEQNCLGFDIPKIQEGFSKQLEYLVEHKSNHATTCIVQRYLRLHYFSIFRAPCMLLQLQRNHHADYANILLHLVVGLGYPKSDTNKFLDFGLGFDKCLDAQPPEVIIFKNSFLIYLYLLDLSILYYKNIQSFF